jgi:hypothetical protein
MDDQITLFDGPRAGPLPQNGWWANFFRNPLAADQQLHAVLLVWALCWLSFGIYLNRYLSPLPWADEWELTTAATGKAPVNFEWIWCPQGEHRAPLTRLEVLGLGLATGWDLRLVHYVNLALLGLGSLALILAARAVRGQSALSDAFLCLLVLMPWQYETVLVYAYAYAMALSCLCLAVSAVMTGWPLRSPVALWLYFLLALVINYSGGPAGNLWAIGLCGVVVRGWLEKKSLTWRLNGLVGSVLVLAAAGSMLWLTPHVRIHEKFHSDSVQTTLRASAKLLVGWLGAPLTVLWPWALLAVVIPGAYLAGRILKDLWRLGRGMPPAETRRAPWVDLGVFLLAAVGVAGMIGHGRGNYTNLWDSRYATLLVPIGVTLYLLMVRLRAPAAISGALAFVMAVCVGWSWPTVIGLGQAWHQAGVPLLKGIQQGNEPLSALAAKHARAVGYDCDPDKLLNLMLLLREADLSLLGKSKQKEPIPGMGRPLVLEAKTARLTGDLNVVADAKAAGGQAIQDASPILPHGAAAFDIEVPTDGIYELCCRVCVPAPKHFLTVQVDDGRPLKRSLPPRPGYYTYTQEPILLDLSTGKHVLTIALGKPGTKLDLLELVPRSRGHERTARLAAP